MSAFESSNSQSSMMHLVSVTTKDITGSHSVQDLDVKSTTASPDPVSQVLSLVKQEGDSCLLGSTVSKDNDADCQDKHQNLPVAATSNSHKVDEEAFRRIKTSITLEKRTKLHLLYSEHGTNKSITWYSTETGISRTVLIKYIEYIVSGHDIRTMTYRQVRPMRESKNITPAKPGPDVLLVGPPIQLGAVPENEEYDSRTLNVDVTPSLHRYDAGRALNASSAMDIGIKESPKRMRRVKEGGTAANTPSMRRNTTTLSSTFIEDGTTGHKTAPTVHSVVIPPRPEPTAQLRENRKLHKEVLEARGRFVSIDVCLNAQTSSDNNGITDEEKTRLKLAFVNKYKQAIVEGRIVVFISVQKCGLHVDGVPNPIELSLVDLFSSAGDIRCELLVGGITTETSCEWILAVSRSMFRQRALLVVAAKEITDMLSSACSGQPRIAVVADSPLLEEYNPTRHMLGIWKQRIKVFTLLDMDQSVGDLLDRLSLEFLSLPRTSILLKLAEIREKKWLELYCSALSLRQL